MAYLVNVKTYQEYADLVYNKDLNISKACVDGILKNLNTKKRFVHLLEIIIEDEDEIVNLSVDRKNFIDTLEKNLKIHIFHEQYEKCVEIKKAIETLNSQL